MNVTELTQDNFAKEVENSKTPILIDFFAEWCGPCQMLAPVFENLSKEYKEKIKFCKVNTEEAPELALKYNITGIPCIILLKKNKETGRMMGFLPKEALKEKIDEMMNG